MDAIPLENLVLLGFNVVAWAAAYYKFGKIEAKIETIERGIKNGE